MYQAFLLPRCTRYIQHMLKLYQPVLQFYLWLIFQLVELSTLGSLIEKMEENSVIDFSERLVVSHLLFQAMLQLRLLCAYSTSDNLEDLDVFLV